MKRLISFMTFFVLSMTVFLTFAYAYIDPSAMTYLIQIIAGVVIACGAAFGFYWRKLKRALRKKKEDDTASDAVDAAEGVDSMIEYADEEDIIDPNAIGEDQEEQ
ncbi:MAG: hypothetical protein E7559_02365 [Ruminococcaceae bacterium]|nr:hypothetical protein [Oscillospiraceae bacterium]